MQVKTNRTKCAPQHRLTLSIKETREYVMPRFKHISGKFKVIPWTGKNRLKKVADCFVFQCCSGLAYTDMVQLSPEDLKHAENGFYIQKQRQKTGTTFTAVILPMGVEIWNKYEGRLPVVSNQKMNSYLHEIEVVCGIKKSLHTHLARKSYASGLLRMGVRIEVVSKTLGHTNTRITQAAYADFLNEDIIKEVTAKI